MIDNQLIRMGVIMNLNNGFATVSNGYFSITAVITGNTDPYIGETYQVYKQGTTYYLGQRLS